MRQVSMLLVLGIACVVLPRSARAQATYDVIDIGPSGSVAGASVNDLGQVAFSVYVQDDSLRGFLWESGVVTDLGTLGGEESYVGRINNVGQVTGASKATDGKWHAFLWEKGVMSDLGTLDGDMSSGSSINEGGQVVGRSTVRGVSQAFFWQDGTMYALPNLPGERGSGSARDVNAWGHAAGESTGRDGTPRHAVVWDALGVHDLGSLSGRTSGAIALNDAGWVVGYSSVPPNDWHHAALWAHGQGFDLGALGGSSAYAQDINNDGTVVGHSQTSAGRVHGFVWSAPTGMLDLNDLVDPGIGELQHAWSVNASGQIAGSMLIPGQGFHCVVLTPRR